MDSKKIKESMEWAVGQAKIWATRSDDQEPARSYMANHYGVLADAARAHLATLPKPPKLLHFWAIDWVFHTLSGVWMPQTTYYMYEHETKYWVEREGKSSRVQLIRVYETMREVPD